MSRHDELVWTKSSASAGQNQCVEVGVSQGRTDAPVLVRNSRFPDGAVLEFTRAEWEAFTAGVSLGEFAA